MSSVVYETVPSAAVDSDFGIDYTRIEDQEYFTANPKSNRFKAYKV